MILTKSLTCKKAVTLIELLIAITLFGLIGLAVISIDFTSRMALVHTTKRTDVYNQARFAMEHMVRHIRLANKVNPTSGTGKTTIDLWRDDNNTPDDMTDDTQLTYEFKLSDKQILFSDTDGSITDEVIANGVMNCRFDIDSWPDNYPYAVTITMTVRNNPGQDESANNPEVTLKSKANLWCRGRI